MNDTATDTAPASQVLPPPIAALPPPARLLSWVPSGGKLTITIHVQRPHIVLRQALNDVRAAIANELGIEILTGQLLPG